MGKTAVFTIASKNYMSKAQVLMQSLKANQENWDRYIFLVDEYEEDDLEVKRLIIKPELYHLIKIAKINLPDYKKMLFRYDILELNTAVKPWCFDFLAFEKAYDSIVYLDPDIRCYSPMIEIDQLLEVEGAIVLTPHITKAIDPVDQFRPTELELMRAGIYNLGFIAVAKGKQTREFFDWWQRKLEYDCVVNLEAGLFVDQKWMDFVPAIFENVTILKHLGYNVAYWNLMQRKVTCISGEYFINGFPLRFFHFSGLDVKKIDNLSKHQNRLTVKEIGIGIELVKEYAKIVLENQFEQTSKLKYAFDYFENNVKIYSELRKLYRESEKIIDKCGENPFACTDYFIGKGKMGFETRKKFISPVMELLWKARPDLQEAFPKYKGQDNLNFAQWFVDSASREYGIDQAYIDPVVKYLTEQKQKDNKIIVIPKKLILKRKLKKIAYENKWILKAVLSEDKWDQLKAKIKPMLDEKTLNYNQENTLHNEVNLEGIKGLNLISYIRGDFGVGESARTIAKALNKSNIEFGIINFEEGSPHSANNHTFDEKIMDEFAYDKNIFIVNADQTEVLAKHYGESAFKGRYNIGMWVWELPDFPDEWVQYAKHYDEIWAPSSFVAEAIAEKVNIPVIRIPYSIEVKPNGQYDRKYFGLPENRFLYVFMYDVLSFQERKNPEAVIDSFIQSFSPEDNRVGLVIKINNGKKHPELIEKLKNKISNHENVFIINKTFGKEEVDSLLNVCDVFVSLHRAEGFGLGDSRSYVFR